MMQLQYDKHGVLKLSLSNPKAQVLFPTGHYTYAFGNTPGINLAEYFRTSKSDESLDFLLLGTGDIRNLLFTVSELYQRLQSQIPASLHFNLNDHDPSIIARDVIILETVRSIDPNCDLDVDFLWNLWYNLSLSSDELKRLQTILQTLSSPKQDDVKSQFGSVTLFTKCLQIWKDWLHLELDIDNVSLQRRRLMVTGLNLAQQETQDAQQDHFNFITAVTSLTNTTVKQLFTPTDEHKLGRKCLHERGFVYKEIYSYFLSGVTPEVQNSPKVNPTLIRPFEHKWKVHYGSCPFSGFIPIDRHRLEIKKCITKVCKEKLKELVKHFQGFIKSKTKHLPIQVTFWEGDALDLCRSGLPKDAVFDIIDTSNLSDHVGLLNILVCCTDRLKEPDQSQLFTSSMLWRASGLSSLQEYLESSLGVRQSLFPTVLGLKLAEDLDLGRSLSHQGTQSLLHGHDIMTLNESRRIEDRMVWVKTERESSPITILRSPDVLSALKSLAARCFRLPSANERCLQLSGVTLSSPMTFFMAFLRIAVTFEEKAEQVLCFIEECLPSVRLFKKRTFSKLCCLSWNVLKCLAGVCPGVVLKAEVRVTFPISSLSRNTPVMQAVLFEDPTDARFLRVWPLSQLEQRTFHRPVHLFYNNVRYDVDQGTVSLLMLEADWKALHEETVLVLISSSVNCTSQAVKLKPETRSSTKTSCCFRNETVMMTSKTDYEMVELSQAKRRMRKSRRSKKNLSCVRISCVSGHVGNGLQKYDSCYRLEILSSQDIIIQNPDHVHKSTDCLVAEERQKKAPSSFVPSGIDSPFDQLEDEVSPETKNSDVVIIHNDGHATEDDSENELLSTTVERVDDITQFCLGSPDVTLVTREVLKTDQLELLALEEHAMCYNADILILRTAEITGPKVKYYPTDLPTAVEISTDCQGKPLRLHFAAPVDERTCKVQLLKDKKRLRCHFPKSDLGVYGPVCIKRIPYLDFSNLPIWTSREDLNILMDFYPMDEDRAAPQDRKPFENLQNALQCVIRSFVESPQENNCFTIHEPRDAGEDCPPNFTIVVQNIYCHQQVPLAKVLFCDHREIPFPLEGNGTATTATTVKYKELLQQVMAGRKESPMVQVTKEGQVLLKRLLYSNAKRLKQTATHDPVWMDSFLQLRFSSDNICYDILE